MAELPHKIRNVLDESRILILVRRFFWDLNTASHSKRALPICMLFLFYGLWFGLTLYRRKRREARRKEKAIWIASK
jgi:hypothetical protein